MTDYEDLMRAANNRAAALAGRDVAALHQLLHPSFGWISHRGQWFDRDAYIAANVADGRRWRSQRFEDVEIRVVADTGVLRCIVSDEIEVGPGEIEVFVMPMTQTWIRDDGRWQCLAGHAGPLLSAVQT
jgi:hypothetical protein